MRSLLVALLLLAGTGTQSASGQYLFLDTNGDATNSRLDMIAAEKWNLVDIWLITDCNKDGTAALPARSGAPLSMFSYEFILHVENGTVEWGKYENLIPQFGFSFGTLQSASEFYTGFAGTETIAPGKYRVGRLAVRATGGAPRIRFESKSPLSPACQTSFGSPNAGRQDDHTIRFGDAIIPSGFTAPWADWYDADGSISQGNLDAAKALETGVLKAFAVAAIRNGVSRDPTLRIQTARMGPLRVRVYDVRGRLIGSLVDETSAAPGSRDVPLRGSRFSSAGIVFYEVQTDEGTARGKIALLK